MSATYFQMVHKNVYVYREKKVRIVKHKHLSNLYEYFVLFLQHLVCLKLFQNENLKKKNNKIQEI